METRRIENETQTNEKEMKMGLSRDDLRIGSILMDLNDSEHTVIRFEGIFIVTTYGRGENWLVPSHLKWERLVKY